MALYITRVVIFLTLLLAMMPAVAEPIDDAQISSGSDSLIPERRKEQFSDSPGYAIFPYPYILPGIGKGIGLVGGAMNVADSYTDVYGVIFGGEVEGLAIGIGDFHLIPHHLILDVGYSDISKVQIMNFAERGMHGEKNDYRLLELDDSAYMGGRLTASFFERKLELFGGWYKGAYQLNSIRDKDGNVLLEAEDAPRDWSEVSLWGGRIDLTDDYADPRRGVRLHVTRFSTPAGDYGPDFYIMDYSFSAYLPVGKQSTWAFNALRSDAVVRKKGVTDPVELQGLMGLNCSDASLTLQQQQYCLQVVNNAVAHNAYGTASSLGGFSYLRSFAQGRFNGAHTQFYGTEFRWNLTNEATPFDIFIMRDIRTAMQLAFFYEMGSTAEHRAEVGDHWKESFGVGFRMITASGVVFRADYAYGDDGPSPQMFIGYPWEL